MDEKLKNIRHSAAHMLAAAVLELYPGTKLGIGPVIENGFYYDFAFPEGVILSVEDLPAVQAKMEAIIKQGHKFEGRKISARAAKKELKDEPFKLDLIKELEANKEKITFYQSGSFVDLCRGGHVEDTTDIPVAGLKLHRIAGAYWRGSEKNPMLTRIYGLLFATKKELDEYLKQQAEAEKRDHRKIGKELDLFSFSEITPGSPFFHPKGAFMFIALQSFLRELYPSWGYQEVITPLIYDSELWKKSGNWDHFREHMFEVQMDHKEAALKPMNCPSHILIYKTSTRSYRDLPLRITDFAPLHRNEIKGTLGGLM